MICWADFNACTNSYYRILGALKQLLSLLRNHELIRVNAHIGICQLDQSNLSAWAYHNTMRVLCNIANLTGDDKVGHAVVAEALIYRAMLLLA